MNFLTFVSIYYCATVSIHSLYYRLPEMSPSAPDGLMIKDHFEPEHNYKLKRKQTVLLHQVVIHMCSMFGRILLKREEKQKHLPSVNGICLVTIYSM